MEIPYQILAFYLFSSCKVFAGSGQEHIDIKVAPKEIVNNIKPLYLIDTSGVAISNTSHNSGSTGKFPGHGNLKAVQMDRSKDHGIITSNRNMVII